MFTLMTDRLPQTHQDLAKAMTGALASAAALANPQAVTVEGGVYPNVDRIQVDLSGARFKSPPPRHAASGQPVSSVTAASLDVRGKPIIYLNASAAFELSARQVKLEVAPDAAGKLGLVLNDAADGTIEARISKSDLQTLLKEGAAEAQNQAKIQDVDLDLESRGPRSLAVTARIKAKAMMMSGTIIVRGRVDIDDQMNAVLSDLDCTGEGMVGQMASGVVKAKLKSYEGRRFALAALSLGNVKLHDVGVEVDNGIVARAKFGT